MPDNTLRDLFHKYYNKTATAAEREALIQFLRENPDDERLTAFIKEAWDGLQAEQPFFDSAQREGILEAILHGSTEAVLPSVDVTPGSADIAPVVPLNRPKIRWQRIAAAAILLLGLAGGYRWYALHRSGAQVVHPLAVAPVKDIAPGGNKAVLVLADGSSIALDSAANGQLSNQAGTRVVKQQNGQLVYRQRASAPGSSASAMGAAATVYNTIVTPRGGQYNVRLADGTRVWLNAASSLRFPTAFTGGDRTVFITGEAYFEVAPDKGKPFRVQTGKATVDVLGTRFNVMAYDDETVLATTLLQGSVRVTEGGKGTLLSPGEQAGFNKETGVTGVATADTSEVIAWKNEEFAFNDVPIQGIMRQLSRWYDIDVRMDGNIAPRKIRGSISRNYNISEVLNMLVFTAGIHYTIAGNKVIISQN